MVQTVPATSDEAQSSSEPTAEAAAPSSEQAEGSNETDTAVSPSEQLSQSRTPVQVQVTGNAAATIDSKEGTTQQRPRVRSSEPVLSRSGVAPVDNAHARGNSSEIAAASTARLKQR